MTNKDRQINLEKDLTLLIEIAKKDKEKGTITLSYVKYLEDHLKLYKRGRQEKEAEMIRDFEVLLNEEIYCECGLNYCPINASISRIIEKLKAMQKNHSQGTKSVTDNTLPKAVIRNKEDLDLNKVKSSDLEPDTHNKKAMRGGRENRMINNFNKESETELWYKRVQIYSNSRELFQKVRRSLTFKQREEMKRRFRIMSIRIQLNSPKMNNDYLKEKILENFIKEEKKIMQKGDNNNE